MPREHYVFVTGKLAEPSLRTVLKELAPTVEFDCSVAVMPITVAALMSPKWIARRIRVLPQATRIILPGYCQGDVRVLEEATGLPVERGPKDLRQLPEYFGKPSQNSDYGDFDIEIIAEINHAPRLSQKELLARAARLEADGADVIDLGCEPRQTWKRVAEAVWALRNEGRRVSIDSYHPGEIEPAIAAGAELVLSVNKTNLRHALGWDCEVVVVPDAAGTLDGLDETTATLSEAGVRFRIDPILNPIAFGFAASLGRYLEVRRRWPQAEMLMGIGNLTELTDADSAAINVILLGFCQELGIRSVLTTQEINWARTAVRECDLARRLVYHAVNRQVLPKHLEPRLVMLRDPRVLDRRPEELDELATAIKDHSYRIFAEGGQLHLITSQLHLTSDNPFDLFEQLLPRAPATIDAAHAFYLGYEMAKAMTALALSKNYRQDEALDWGMLTVAELTRRERRAARMARRGKGCDEDEETVSQ